MKLLVIAAAFVFAVEARHLSSDQEEWEQFKIQQGKTYISSLEERQRFQIFQSNLRTIEEHNERFNRGEETFSMAMNLFGDMTQEEFEDILALKVPERDISNNATLEYGDVPAAIDWRKLGAVTGVKTQGKCGACWAFSAVGALEGQVFIHKKVLEPLSEEQLIDCATAEYYNLGCKGGYETTAFNYVRDHGIMSDKEYPYTAGSGTCLKQGGLKISGYRSIPENDENALTRAIATIGPVSVTIDAKGLRFYQKGVVDGRNCGNTRENLNHAVVFVGYENDYYIAKNSWGPGWGDQGYFRIQRNKNTCGIALFNSYPVL